MGVLHSANLRLNRTFAGWRTAHRALPGSWRLVRETLRSGRAEWKLLVKIVALILIPTTIIGGLTTDPTNPAADSSITAYIAFANFIMSAAVIWAVIAREEGSYMSVRRAYYDGSGLIVRLLLLSVLLALMLLPLLLGLALVGFGILAPEAALSLGEKLLLGLLALILATPSIIWISRASVSVYALAEQGVGPLQAVRTSRALTKGKLMPVLARLLTLLITLLVVLIIPEGITAVLLAVGSQAAWLSGVLQIITGMIVLPFANIYLYKLYRSLL